MHLIRFLDYLDEWAKATKYKKLSNIVLNDCISKDGDLSFFLIKNFDGDFFTKEILNVVCRYVFNNFSRWENANKDNGVVFLPRKKVEKRIKPVDEDDPSVLGTIHCNMSKVLSAESTKLQKVIYKYRKQSCYYNLLSIANTIYSLSSSEWDQLFSLVDPKNIKNIACKINKEFFRRKNRSAPQELLKRIN